MIGDPTLVMIPGAWHGAWVWDRLRAEMPDVSTVAVDLPSVGDLTRDTRDDVLAVRAAVERVDGPLVVLAHSFGGFAVSEALDPAPSIRRIVFLAAVMPEIGETTEDRFGEKGFPSWWAVHDGAVTPIGPCARLYHDVPEAEARRAVERLAPQSVASMEAIPTRAAWHTIPSTYLLCEDDRALPTAVQETIAARAQRIRRLAGGHSPMLSRPGELAEIVRAELG